ncbi:MAG: glycogen/starch/alpha-glucan phosphorylase [Fibrobacter sp.]|nr:glycogen/starch/alpha-glucan phosphorylase [Fibrobacter sp.]
MESKELKDSFYRYLRYFLAKDDSTATSYDKYMALAYAVRSELVDNWIKTQKTYYEHNVRRVFFLSMEYIFGKSLRHNLLNLGIEQPMNTAVRSLGISLQEIYSQEDDFELGNSGRGKSAVCFIESMATLGIPAMGYGLSYDYSQFQQDIRNGVQVERPYDWLNRGHPWEIVRPEYSCSVGFAGDCQPINPDMTLGPYEWKASELVHAIPHDVPIPGYRNGVVNTLRLWSARASEEFLADYANHNDYVRACEEKSQLGRITKVLFPEEDIRRATELRMKQQFFFVSAALQDIIRRYKTCNSSILDLHKKTIIHLNGSRCALAVPELMRILVDVENVPWDKAWEITKNVFAYTSNAILRDNLEAWPIYKVAKILPRHMQIIFDLNQVHLEEIRKTISTDDEFIRDLSLIEEGEVKRIKLANLAVAGSFSVNGVSREQSEIIKKKLFPSYVRCSPGKFTNATTGVAHRRWLVCINCELTNLINSAIGEKWITDPQELANLESYVVDTGFLNELAVIKTKAKENLASAIEKNTGIKPDTSSMFDVQSGKIHNYKRQVLHILNVLYRYQMLKSGNKLDCSRVHIFSGKASPSDFLAKQIIHLINVTADLVNKDPEISDLMKVVFVPNFGMSWAELMIPAADLSEQLSTPSFEAASTFNMKYAFNGALTIASRCGTNIELIEKVGAENIFLFGKNSEEISSIQNYRPNDLLSSDQRLKEIFSLIEGLLPSIPDGSAIYPLLSSIRDSDRYFVLIDFDDYIKKQTEIDKFYINKLEWSRKSLMNIARMGYFSSDRTVIEYSQSIWKVLAP